MERQAIPAFVGLGANLGDAAAALQSAFASLAALPATTLLRRSALYRTAPVDATGPDYLNAVAEIATALAPLALLRELLAIEQAAGRIRPFLNAPRTLDLDLLLYGDVIVDLPGLTVPHPRLRSRAFVLVPLAEIAPQVVPATWLIAVRGQAIHRLCDARQ